MAWLDYGQDFPASPATTFTFSGLDIGAADADRWILIGGIGGGLSGGTATTSVTINAGSGDISASLLDAATAGAPLGGTIPFCWKVLVPAGTTATVTVVFNGNVSVTSIAVARFIGEPIFEDVDADDSMGVDAVLNNAVDVAADGYVQSLVQWFGAPAAGVTFGGLTSDFQDFTLNPRFFGASGFSATPITGASITATLTTNTTSFDMFVSFSFTLAPVAPAPVQAKRWSGAAWENVTLRGWDGAAWRAGKVWDGSEWREQT